jgi:hypothetical protein
MRIANGEELDDGVDEPDAYDWRDRHDSYHKHLYVDAPPKQVWDGEKWISDPTRHFRPCYGCGERFHPDDMHTIDIEKYGEHDTAEICDGCKESHADTPRIADIDLDAMSFDENA